MDNPDKNQTQNLRAIIDVGSNSVKLLVAEVAEYPARPDSIPLGSVDGEGLLVLPACAVGLCEPAQGCPRPSQRT